MLKGLSQYVFFTISWFNNICFRLRTAERTQLLQNVSCMRVILKGLDKFFTCMNLLDCLCYRVPSLLLTTLFVQYHLPGVWRGLHSWKRKSEYLQLNIPLRYVKIKLLYSIDDLSHYHKMPYTYLYQIWGPTVQMFGRTPSIL